MFQGRAKKITLSAFNIGLSVSEIFDAPLPGRADGGEQNKSHAPDAGGSSDVLLHSVGTFTCCCTVSATLSLHYA